MVLPCAWRLSLADVEDEVSRVRRKAIYGRVVKFLRVSFRGS